MFLLNTIFMSQNVVIKQLILKINYKYYYIIFIILEYIIILPSKLIII